MRLGFKCWRCGARSTVKKMRHMSAILVEATYVCRNEFCGHTFVAAIEAVRTLSPGAFPAPAGVHVPLSMHVARSQLIRELSTLPQAQNEMDLLGLRLPDHARQEDLFGGLDGLVAQPVDHMALHTAATLAAGGREAPGSRPRDRRGERPRERPREAAG